MVNRVKITILFFAIICVHALFGQDHGDDLYRARNDHSGNLIRVTYHNHGMLGAIKGDNSLVYGGEWPINSGMVQMGNASSYVTSELTVLEKVDPQTGDSIYVKITPVVFCQGWDPNMFSHDSLGNFLGFEPLPGYYNVDNPDFFHKSAMSHQPNTWPPIWPDKLEDAVDPGWRGFWNGYFGKGVMNADQESYHVLDDYQFKKKIGTVYIPPPDPLEPNRGGLGLRKSIRGLQWSNPDAEDCIFWIYEITNIGENKLKKTAFGLNVGASMGAIVGQNSDWMDDAATFYREIGLTVNYDWDNVGTAGYTPVPWVGFAFLESPGNALDGIDNDGDGIDAPGGGKIITTLDFMRVVSSGDPIVLIDYDSDDYKRTVTTMPAEGISFTFEGVTYTKFPGTPLEEIPRNGVDDNLNGIIDESDGAEITETGEVYYLYVRDPIYNNQDYLSKDYIAGIGLDNLMIDERRDDKIDNDGDWDPYSDDVGLDGAEGTGDYGEGDGIPTPAQGDLPGEPNIDRVDVSESDQIGLTSFIFYEYGSITYSNDDQMWFVNRPGFFDSHLENVDADYIFSSGYFPILPGKKEAFSVGMIYGWDEQDIIKNKAIVQNIYDANYNFAVAPQLPTVWAVPGDGKVTLYWDDKAEESKDRYLKEYDFEGYKIYRATDPGFEDAGTITDGYGYPRFKQPIAVYDKIDSVFGFFPNTFGTGVQFYLGAETGLAHTYVDSPLVNGQRYFYAVTAFDKGSVEFNISPSETNKYVTIDASGEIQTAQNVVWVIPSAPSLGYVPPGFDTQPEHIGPEIVGNGLVRCRYIEPDSLVDGDHYEIQFLDISSDNRDNDGDELIDADDPDEIIPIETSGFVLKNITDESNPTVFDTVWFKEYRLIDSNWIAIKNLYNDDDKDSSSLRTIINGIEFFIYNPHPGILTKVDENGEGIIKGIKWSSNIIYDQSYDLRYELWGESGYIPGQFYPRQYRIVFFDDIADTSVELLLLRENGTIKRITSTETNFRVYDFYTGEELDYAFRENLPSYLSLAPPGHFSAKDEIWFFEKLPNGETIVTFYLLNNTLSDQGFIDNYARTLGSGDTLYLYTETQFTSEDRFQFTVQGQRIDKRKTRQSLDRIKVVPNPYVVTAAWEPRNPYTSGRGPRSVRFIHLPQICTIRIYAVDGTLVRTLKHESSLTDGSEEWDLLTKDNMDIAYGLYIYHVEAPGIGERVGRMIIIK